VLVGLVLNFASFCGAQKVVLKAAPHAFISRPHQLGAHRLLFVSGVRLAEMFLSCIIHHLFGVQAKSGEPVYVVVLSHADVEFLMSLAWVRLRNGMCMRVLERGCLICDFVRSTFVYCCSGLAQDCCLHLHRHAVASLLLHVSANWL